MKRTEEIQKYRESNLEKLNEELRLAQKKISNLSLKVAAGKESNFSEIGKTRKSIARISSIISEKRAE